MVGIEAENQQCSIRRSGIDACGFDEQLDGQPVID